MFVLKALMFVFFSVMLITKVHRQALKTRSTQREQSKVKQSKAKELYAHH
jgi:hypothetical protein